MRDELKELVEALEPEDIFNTGNVLKHSNGKTFVISMGKIPETGKEHKFSAVVLTGTYLAAHAGEEIEALNDGDGWELSSLQEAAALTAGSTSGFEYIFKPGNVLASYSRHDDRSVSVVYLHEAPPDASVKGQFNGLLICDTSGDNKGIGETSWYLQRESAWRLSSLEEAAQQYQDEKHPKTKEDIFKPGNVLVARPGFSVLNSYTYFVLVARDDSPSEGYFKGTVLATGDPDWEPGDFRVTWAKEARLWRTSRLEEAAEYQRKNMTGETIRGPEVKLDKW